MSIKNFLVLSALILLSVTHASAQTYGDLLKEREANYAKYMDKIKQFFPEGWNPGDLIEAKLKDPQGQRVDYLLLLVFRSADAKMKTLARGKVMVLQRVNNDFVKKWESTDDIEAVDGIIGELMGVNRYPFDINKDGLDEIFVTFSISKIPTQGLVHLWIYSWDGTQGNLISSRGEGVLKGLSVFTGSQLQPPSLMDDDNDGIYEVFAQDKKIYKWDSSQRSYVYWKDERFTDETTK